MRSVFILALSAVLSIAFATSHLVAYSTSAHFQCRITAANPCDAEHPSTVSVRLLPTLLQHLMSTNKDNTGRKDTALPLADVANATPARVVVLVHSVSALDSASLIHQIADAIPSDTASSFRAPMEGIVTRDTFVGHQFTSVTEFRTFLHGKDDNSINMDEPNIVLVPAPTQRDLTDLFDILRSTAPHVHDLAVIFAVNHDADTDQGDPANPPEGDAPAGDSDTQDTNETSGSQDEKTMTPPEITAAQLTGLLVAVMFLIIFIPGFLCLWRIQTPQTFAILDSNDMKKKIQ